jgi:hypothetical protein
MKPLVVALCCLPLASCASTSPPVGPAAVTIEEVPHADPVCDKSTRARITQIVENNLPVVLRWPAESVHRRVYADAMFDALDEAMGLSADERPGSGTTDFNRIADENVQRLNHMGRLAPCIDFQNAEIRRVELKDGD